MPLEAWGRQALLLPAAQVLLLLPLLLLVNRLVIQQVQPLPVLAARPCPPAPLLLPVLVGWQVPKAHQAGQEAGQEGPQGHAALLPHRGQVPSQLRLGRAAAPQWLPGLWLPLLAAVRPCRRGLPLQERG